MSYVFDKKEWIKRAEYCANWIGGTAYENSFPYNCCLLDSNNVLWADCVNLQKCLLNGYDVYHMQKGTHCSDFHNTGDCGEYGLLEQCTEISNNFGKLDSDPTILYMSGHIGMYLGKEVVKNGKVYNSVECTAAWGGGILYSYVSSTGARFNHKNGSQNGYWERHGKPTKWVDYSEVIKIETVKLNGYKTMTQIQKDVNVRSDYSLETKVASFSLPRGEYQLTVLCRFDADPDGTRYMALVANSKKMSAPYTENKSASPNGPTRLSMSRPIKILEKTVFDVYVSQNGSKSLKVSTYAGYHK